MCAGADSIDDIDVVRSGGMKTLFDGVYAPSTVGTLLREFTFGHARQLESVLREHLVARCAERVDLLPGADDAGVHRYRLAAAPGLRARQTGRLLRAHQDRRQAGPAQGTVAVGDHDQHRLARAGDRRDAAARRARPAPARAPAAMVAQAIGTARAAGASGQILVRGDSAYGNRTVVRARCRAPAPSSRWC